MYVPPMPDGPVIGVDAGGTKLLAGVIKSNRRGLSLLATSSILGVATFCMGWLRGLWPVAALLMLMGCFSGFINVQFQAWFQQRVDRAVLGRVISVSMLSAYGLMPLSMAAAGVAVEWNAQLMFAIAGVAVILTSAFGALQKPVRDIK